VVLADPVGGALRRLVDAGLVLAGRDGRAAVAFAKSCVADEAGRAGDEFLDLIAALIDQIEQLGCARARAGSVRRGL
jgi:hypothetical protein